MIFKVIEDNIQAVLTKSLQYDYSANLTVEEVSLEWQDSNILRVGVDLSMPGAKSETNRVITKEYTIELNDNTTRLIVMVVKDVLVDNYFSLHQLKEMNYLIAGVIASSLGSTHQPVRIKD